MEIKEAPKKLTVKQRAEYVAEGHERRLNADKAQESYQSFVRIMVKSSAGKQVIADMCSDLRTEHEERKKAMTPEQRKKAPKQHPEIAKLRTMLSRCVAKDSKTVPTVQYDKDRQTFVVRQHTRSGGSGRAKGVADYLEKAAELLQSGHPDLRSKLEYVNVFAKKLGVENRVTCNWSGTTADTKKI